MPLNIGFTLESNLGVKATAKVVYSIQSFNVYMRVALAKTVKRVEKVSKLVLDRT